MRHILVNWFLIFVVAFSGSALISNYRAEAAQHDVMVSTTSTFGIYRSSVESTVVPTPEPPLTQPAVVADPTSDLGGWLNQLKRDWSNGSYVAVVLLALFGMLAIARKYIPWLKVGRRAAVVAATTTFLTTIITGLSTDHVPNLSLIIAAISAGIALYLDSGKPKNVVIVEPQPL